VETKNHGPWGSDAYGIEWKCRATGTYCLHHEDAIDLLLLAFDLSNDVE